MGPLREILLEEGEETYNYMINNFEKLIDGNTIKHFGIRYTNGPTIDHYRAISRIYKEELEEALIPWIRKEIAEKRLFERDNWRTFRDCCIIETMYIGYKKLFQYEEFYFKLVVDPYHWNDKNPCNNDCKYCINNTNEENCNDAGGYHHIELGLYGWKDDRFEKLQPSDQVVMGDDNMMPSFHWDREL